MNGWHGRGPIGYSFARWSGVVNMNMIYHLNANDLDEKFIQSLSALFKDKDIEITVSEVHERAYLPRSETNKERLLRTVANVEKGENLIEADTGDLNWSK